MNRGGRTGRGGRWFGRGSVTRDLIRDNLEDLGIENNHYYDDRLPPPLYPAVELPFPPVVLDLEWETFEKVIDESIRQR